MTRLSQPDGRSRYTTTLVPWNGSIVGQEAPLTERADLDLAAATARTGLDVAGGERHVRPFACLRHQPLQTIETRREQLPASRRPLHRVDAVHDAGEGRRDLLARPGVGTVRVDGRPSLVLRRDNAGARERRDDQPRRLAWLDPHPAHAMRRRHGVDGAGGPRLRRVVTVCQQQHLADAARRVGLELVRQRDLGDAVAVQIVRVQVDDARHRRREHMARPGGVLVPRQVLGALVDDDDVEALVAIQVGQHQLIAHAQAGHDRRGLEGGQCRGRRRPGPLTTAAA